MKSEQGQGTAEWVGMLLVVALLLMGLVAAGMRVPGAALAHSIASRILCAAALADSCGDEPGLIAAYGTEVGELVRRHMPSIAFERRSRGLPVDFRRCRSNACGDGAARGIADRTDSGLPVTAFVHVVDCRAAAARETVASDGGEDAPAAPDCSGGAAGNLYIQYWTYYADSATLRGVPVVGALGYHPDDWEGVQIRIGPDGRVDERATSHHGFDYRPGIANAGAEAGAAPLEEGAELLGARARGGWGPETRLLFVAGGSHAGSATGGLYAGRAARDGAPQLDPEAAAEVFHVDRLVRGRSVRLVPLEPILSALSGYRFAISPPWRKHVWGHPEVADTD